MDKTANCIKMLELLTTHKRLKKEELAERLETNVRNIVEYRKELENAGYIIDYISGQDGGYEINSKNYLPSLKLTIEEKNAFQEAIEYIRKRTDFMQQKEFDNAVCKIQNTDNLKSQLDFSIYYRFPLSMNPEEIQMRFNIISESIKNLTKLEILYTSKKNEDHIHIIYPLKLYLYTDSWFVLAYKEGLGKILYYKINRIKEIKVLKETFRVPLFYKESDYLDDFGMKNNAEWIDVKFLMINNANTMLNERIYGKNQKIEKIDNSRSILSATMQDKEILAFILGWGTNCKVLEPQSLKQRVKEEIEKMLNIYSE